MPDRKCDGCRHQQEWGCTAKSVLVARKDGELEEVWVNPAHMPVQVLGEDIWSCPRQPLREEPLVWAAILKFYGMYAKGHFPDRGAVVDQSNKAIETFRIIDDVNAQCDRIEAEEAAKKRNKTPPGRTPNRGRQR